MKKISAKGLSVNINSNIKEALKIIDDAGIGACVVVNNENVFVGILTDGDIRRSFLNGVELDDLVSEIVNTGAFTINEDSEDQIGPLDEKIKHIPTYLHHSKNDKTSKFSMAELAYKELSKINNNVEFNIGNSGHSGWGKLYADKEIINWLLSWKKNKK